MQNWSSYIQKSLILAIFYLLLTGNLELANLVVGVLIGMATSLLTPSRALYIPWRRLPEAIWAGLRYLVVIIVDLIVSGIQVGKIVLSPRLQIDPGLVEIEAGCKSELNSALTAHAISLTPGELVVEMDDDGTLYAHALNMEQSAQASADAIRIRRQLLDKIFE
jgi:multicomponent Na+:H+ antiporter subunit E